MVSEVLADIGKSKPSVAEGTSWYLRWDSLAENGSSIYWSLAEELAGRYGWETQPAALAALAALRKQYARAVDAADARRAAALEELRAIEQQTAARIAGSGSDNRDQELVERQSTVKAAGRESRTT